ncbi:MAG: carboxypeptidase-like regulatory domain-containing protein, partial [Prevotella sp.]|nr:carboxypeptidase-like regulatory domain-containing protein [Prevotella sp.]
MRETIRKFLVLLMLFMASQTFLSTEAQAQITKKVTMNLVQVPIKDFFNAVKAQTGHNFIMKSSDKNGLRVTVNAKDKPASEVLTETLHQIGCMYEVEDGYVTVTDMPSGDVRPVSTRHLTGYVTDTDGQPLPGAYIIIKGTRQGAVTNEEGFYDFTVPNGAITLVFSYVGMTEKEVTYSGRGDVKKNVTLRSNTDIEEVVVTGYNMVERRKLTSSVTTLNAEDIMRPGI